MAKLIARLGAAGPKAIGFDIVYTEADMSNPDDDRMLAAAIQGAGNVVMGYYLYLESTASMRRHLKPLDPEFENLVVEKQVFPAERRPAGGSREIDAMMNGKDLELALPLFNKAAASFGFVNFHADDEGRLRYQPQLIEFEGHLYTSLDLQLLKRYLDAPSIVVDIQDKRIAQVQVGNEVIPTDQFGRFMLNYRGPRGSFPTYPMIDVMEDRVPADRFKDKIVLIGAPAIGLADVVATPYDAVLPGVELHATVIDNVLHKNYLYRDGLAKFIDLGLILIFGTVVSVFLPKLNASRSLFYTSLLFAAFTALNVWAFLSLNLVLSYVYPGMALVLTSIGMTGYKYVTEEKARKKTRSTFQYYLDQHVIDKVMNDPEMLKLGGEKREMSVLFSDIRGFTSFTEKMAPSEVVAFLNQYFDRMTTLIFKNKGTLDKLIGDAVMCFWGHPIVTKDHAVRGTLTALEMIQAVNDLRSVLVLPGGARFEIGIGVNTGQMVVGNMGSQNRFSYTVMGDNVNLGSRLESLNKYYGTNILISDSTYEEIKELIFCRQLDTIQVKGKSQAVTIYEPLGMRRLEHERRKEDRRGPATMGKQVKKGMIMARFGDRRVEERRAGSDRLIVKPEQEEIATMYEHALGLYRKGDFDAAEMAFDHVLSLSPTDGPSRLMKGRIAKYRKEYADTESAFDPVYKFDEK